jgi:tetratricopeptide (TPR) repeat protein
LQNLCFKGNYLALLQFKLGDYMKKKDTENGKYVKKETLLIVASVALLVGFFGGVVFGVYKSSKGDPVQKSVMPQPTEKDQDVSAEKGVQIFELEKKTSETPDDVTAWIDLGNLYFDSGNPEKAITAYNKSLELNPNNADVMNDLGVMYRRAGQPKKAIEAFDKAIKINPGHETVRFNKGIVLMHDLNDLEGTVQAWEELVKLNPNAISPTGQPVKELVENLKKSMKQ